MQLEEALFAAHTSGGMNAAKAAAQTNQLRSLEAHLAGTGAAGTGAKARTTVTAGPGICCSPRHWVPFDSSNEGGKCVG